MASDSETEFFINTQVVKKNEKGKGNDSHEAKDSLEETQLPTPLEAQALPPPDGKEGVGTSVVEYFFLILFNWDVDDRNPFSCFVWSLFDDNDITHGWITGPLYDSYRMMEISPSCLNGKYSLFCKVEKGKLINVSR